MIPDNMKRTGQPRAAGTGRANLPLPLVVAGVVLLAAVLVFAGVALTMGTPPAQQEMAVDVPLE